MAPVTDDAETKSDDPATQTAASPPKRSKRRHAVIMVHGMGEQRPLDTLLSFANFVAPQAPKPRLRRWIARRFGQLPERDDAPPFYSRPTRLKDAFESRYVIVPQDKEKARDQLDVYEYHWSYLMQGNKLSDVLATTVRMVFRWPGDVPRGLRGAWWLVWATIAAVIYQLITNREMLAEALTSDWADVLITLLATALGIGAGTLLLRAIRWVLKDFIPSKITSHLVDVIRYLDVSPRSYAVRRAIRKGIVELLDDLHNLKDSEGRDQYDRIILVGHSLGAYIAYDAISYYWTQTNEAHAGKLDSAVIEAVERAALPLMPGTVGSDNPTEEEIGAFRDAQKALWQELRAKKSPWKVSDFISIGTPMYMADQLMTKHTDQFQERVDLRHIATCPPQRDYPRPGADSAAPGTPPDYSYYDHGKQVLYHAAPFAVVRWTNMWFPARFNFFGDWFGDELGPLFGRGIKDVPLRGDSRCQRSIPAWAHAQYFASPEAVGSGGKVTAHEALIKALELNFFELPAAPEEGRGQSAF